jgi:Na+-transporting NADH:ubiquinone oxidoreductase subunit B
MGFAQFRGHAVNEGFLVTGMLIPLCMPPDVPLWMVALATAFAVVIGKEVFGGTGMNLLNPALTARMFLYIGYPSSMSGDAVWAAIPEGASTVDAYSGATALGNLASASSAGEGWSNSLLQGGSIMPSFLGNIQGSIGETSVVAILIGAVILVAAGVGSWKIMASTFLGGLFMGWIFNVSGGNGAWMDIPSFYHLIIGGFAFGAVFMATDPVSAAQTETGKWVYGFLIGVITVLIRVFNPGYPEGIMMAILLMNVFAPLIDYYVVQSNIKTRLKRVQV